MIFSTALIATIISSVAAIDWNRDQNGDWASNCDFPGNDISWQQTEGPQCSAYCRSVPGCTQYSYYQGWCYAKSGGLGRNNAIDKQDVTCGINNPPSTPPPPSGNGYCQAELSAKRQQYRGINSPLSWNQDFANRAASVANPWVGHHDLGNGAGGFVGGQIMAGTEDCNYAIQLWVENEMTAWGNGVCKDGEAGGHCRIILNPGYHNVGCAHTGGNAVCDFN
ncbi:hypothetical protein HDV01_007697 [Terramyces sp. JEL0728]|nr:hypothetical protein HDV01_000534 [Terramyces sp. JEL0728]KAJ3270601.1 hypothetical protein HDV01_007697 [Terramyces sp. JEL0728]